ncbi:Dna2-domain-containing protein [Sistotremastrum niveocremeum HHB9708]|uniref:DNA replication ATP-dependent helicase/nuclease n=1 Tax=Sistotremastrum niveocremeum HHB9708 TaxID=1314777 RepID=A0A164N5B6_9AGAM|nr:Dna2-domain-containing protein [Sistotremastrum niveocremeum HHB9708]
MSNLTLNSSEEDALMASLLGDIDGVLEKVLPRSRSTSPKKPHQTSAAGQDGGLIDEVTDDWDFGSWDDMLEDAGLIQAASAVVPVTPVPPIIVVKVEGTGERREVILRDDWICSIVRRGDIVNVIGEFTTLLGTSAQQSSPIKARISISSQYNYIILHPDVLLSATYISHTSKCSRKPLISALFKSSAPVAGSSTGSPAPYSSAVVWGNILHEVFQRSLSDNEWSEKATDSKIDEVIRSPNFLGEIVQSGVNLNQAKQEIKERAKGLAGFSQKYLGEIPKPDAILSNPRSKEGAEPRLAISQLHDTEEDIWSPTFGLKGKIDASVQAIIQEQPQGIRTNTVIKATSGTMPFEIKTGRTFSMLEHRAQTMLYTLLVAERYGVQVPAGLLYYTQSEEVIQVPATRNELRGLIIARNEMASYISKRRTSLAQSTGEEELLPPTIDDEWSCGHCYAVDACMLYRKAVERIEDTTSDIALLYREKTGHLTEAQCDFFQKWEELISIEEQDTWRILKELWTMTAEERESQGRCFADMRVESYQNHSSSATSRIHRHSYKFVRSSAGGGSLLKGTLSVGDAVTVSIEPDLYGLTRGFLISLSPEYVVVGVDHALNVKELMSRTGRSGGSQDMVKFRIDKDEMASGLSRIRDNLARLFIAEGDKKRLSLVVDLRAPTFTSEPQFPALESTILNVNQQQAMDKVLTADDYALILGMPGTGKTTVIAEIMQTLVANGKTVLLASYTHSAVDNILLKLKSFDFDILRLGNLDKIHPDCHRYSLHTKTRPETIEALEDQILRPPVVATTCLSVDQLAREKGFDVSLFRRLSEAHPHAVVDLAYQYRMNEDIMTLSNRLVYSDRLRCGSAEVAKRCLRLPDDAPLKKLHEAGKPCHPDGCWLQKLLDPNCKAVFVDTDASTAEDSHDGNLVQNEAEASYTLEVTQMLIRCGIAAKDIGIISPYRQQLKVIGEKLRDHSDLELLTADRSQGRDKECVIISLVRSNQDGQVGALLKDWRRMNVAFTRARSKLILFGSRRTLNNLPLMSDFFELMEEKKWILTLPPDAHQLHSTGPSNSLGKRSSPTEAVKIGKENRQNQKENETTGAIVSPRKVKRAKVDIVTLLKGRPVLGDIVNQAIR